MRKKKSLYNVLFSSILYFITMIFTFVTQAVIVKILGIEYSGVNGLFTNILTMLSIAELGIGTSIIFKLYNPIAQNDIDKIKSWLKFYKRCYIIIAIVVLTIGVIIIPFVPVIVGKTSINENVLVLYFISLIDVVLSYVMTYKRSLLYADQKNYVINIVHIGYVAFMNCTQIIVIAITKNYLYFLLIKLIYRVLENVIINIYVNKKYPYVKESANEIEPVEKKDIFERIKAIFLQKISFVVNKGIDNIVISIFMGVMTVGYYTNYNLVATTLCGIIFQVISAFMASVGNLLTENNSSKNYSVYRKITFLNSSMTAIAISGFLCAIQSFVKMWVGGSYVLDLGIVIAFCVYIYSDSIRRSITIYKEAAGICKEDKYVYIIMALINLISSIVLCKFIGISGVILGTALSYLFLIFYSYPKYIFQNVFKIGCKEYYFEKIKFIIVIIVSSLISYFVTNNTYNINSSILNFIANGSAALLITTIIICIAYFKSEELRSVFKGKLVRSKNEK